MSYTISISGLEIDCNYTSNYSLLNENNLTYFIQIVTDQTRTYNFYGEGVPIINTDNVAVNKSLFILTVFSDNVNTILMPTIFLQDITPYKGLTLKAFVNDNDNSIRKTNISDVYQLDNNNIYIYNVNSKNYIVSNIINGQSVVWLMYQPVGKNLDIDFTNSSQYYDSSVNTRVSTLIINTQLYNIIVNRVMPNYFTNLSISGPSSIMNNGVASSTDDNPPPPPPQINTTTKKSNNMLIIFIILIIIVIGSFAIYYFITKKRHHIDS